MGRRAASPPSACGRGAPGGWGSVKGRGSAGSERAWWRHGDREPEREREGPAEAQVVGCGGAEPRLWTAGPGSSGGTAENKKKHVTVTHTHLETLGTLFFVTSFEVFHAKYQAV